jgi:hypothetical protein
MGGFQRRLVGRNIDDVEILYSLFTATVHRQIYPSRSSFDFRVCVMLRSHHPTFLIPPMLS